jgi:hypothetical protein
MNLSARESQLLELFPHPSSLLELSFPTLLERSISEPRVIVIWAPSETDVNELEYGKGCCLTKMPEELRCGAAHPLWFLYVCSS